MQLHHPKVTILAGDNRKTLRTLDPDSVHCVVTSPPYWGQRLYGKSDSEIGREEDLEEYIAALVKVFHRVKRVLHPTGVVWLNIADVFKDKQLLGLPWKLVFALQADGWYFRTDIIWHKMSGLPEAAKDRPSRSHEYLFMLTKSLNYFYDIEAAKVPSVVSDKVTTKGGAVPLVRRRSVWQISSGSNKTSHTAAFPETLVEACLNGSLSERGVCVKCGTPWKRFEKGREQITNIAFNKAMGGTADGKYKGKTTKNYAGTKAQNPGRAKANILASMNIRKIWGWQSDCKCKTKDKPKPATVLDPFAGSGTTGVVAKRLGANVIMCELYSEHIKTIKERLSQV